MTLSPLDIAQRQFASAWRGLDADEVHRFLQQISHAMTRLVQEKNELQSNFRAQAEVLEGLRGREEDVKETLVTAQRAVEQQRAQAAEEARLKIEAASLEAKQIVGAAEERAATLHRQIGELTRQRIGLVEELRGVLATHVRMLELYGQDGPREAKERGQGLRGQVPLETIAAPAPPGFQEGSRPARTSRKAEARGARQKE